MLINDQFLRKQTCNRLYGAGTCQKIFGTDFPTVRAIANWKATWEDRNTTPYKPAFAFHINEMAKEHGLNPLFYQVVNKRRLAFYYDEDLVLFKLLYT